MTHFNGELVYNRGLLQEFHPWRSLEILGRFFFVVFFRQFENESMLEFVLSFAACCNWFVLDCAILVELFGVNVVFNIIVNEKRFHFSNLRISDIQCNQLKQYWLMFSKLYLLHSWFKLIQLVHILIKNWPKRYRLDWVTRQFPRNIT